MATVVACVGCELHFRTVAELERHSVEDCPYYRELGETGALDEVQGVGVELAALGAGAALAGFEIGHVEPRTTRIVSPGELARLQSIAREENALQLKCPHKLELAELELWHFLKFVRPHRGDAPPMYYLCCPECEEMLR